MRRKFAFVCLLAAWLCANGVVWNLVQVVGWTKMLHDNAETMSFARAVQVTFSGEAPCEFCRLAESGREQTQQLPPQAALGGALEKILFVADAAPLVVLPAPSIEWPGLASETGRRRVEAVPVPPPRCT